MSIVAELITSEDKQVLSIRPGQEDLISSTSQAAAAQFYNMEPSVSLGIRVEHLHIYIYNFSIQAISVVHLLFILTVRLSVCMYVCMSV